MNENAKFELLMQLIQRYDSLRSSLSNRAATVLSCNAIFIGVISFSVDKLISNDQLFVGIKVFLTFMAIATICFLFISITKTIYVIANIWRNSRSLFGEENPKRLFFQAKETSEHFKTFLDFSKEYHEIGYEKLIDIGLSELWSIQKMYNMRYKELSTAMKYLLYSQIPLSISILTLLTLSLIK